METKHWIFLSPHFDDVALSCGGLVWQLTNEGHRVEIWTIMAGLPTEGPYSEFARQNHEAWGMSGKAAILMRQAEDRAACAILGASARHCSWRDVIYRQDQETGNPVVNNNEELFGEPPEAYLVEEISQFLVNEIQDTVQLVFPMGLGGHIDHRVLVQAGKCSAMVNLVYADYPYILTDFSAQETDRNQWARIPHALGEEALTHWQDAVLCYTSQLSGFWHNEAEARLALRNYLAGGGGRLWTKVRD